METPPNRLWGYCLGEAQKSPNSEWEYIYSSRNKPQPTRRPSTPPEKIVKGVKNVPEIMSMLAEPGIVIWATDFQIHEKRPLKGGESRYSAIWTRFACVALSSRDTFKNLPWRSTGVVSKQLCSLYKLTYLHTCVGEGTRRGSAAFVIRCTTLYYIVITTTRSLELVRIY